MAFVTIQKNYGDLNASIVIIVDNYEVSSQSFETPIAHGQRSGISPTPWPCKICGVGHVWRYELTTRVEFFSNNSLPLVFGETFFFLLPRSRLCVRVY